MSSTGPKEKKTTSIDNSQFEKMYYDIVMEVISPKELRKTIGKAEYARLIAFIESLTEEEEEAIGKKYSAKEISELSREGLIERFEQLVVTKPKPFSVNEDGKLQINMEVFQALSDANKQESLEELKRDFPDTYNAVLKELKEIDALTKERNRLQAVLDSGEIRKQAVRDIIAEIERTEAEAPTRRKQNKSCSMM